MCQTEADRRDVLRAPPWRPALPGSEHFCTRVLRRAAARVREVSSGPEKLSITDNSVEEGLCQKVLYRISPVFRSGGRPDVRRHVLPRRRAAHVRMGARTGDWGNSIENFFAQTFIHTIVSDAELLRS